MKLPEHTAHSFVIRIWWEVTAVDTNDGEWRGHITYIPRNERRHFDNLNDLFAVISAYLETEKPNSHSPQEGQ